MIKFKIATFIILLTLGSETLADDFELIDNSMVHIACIDKNGKNKSIGSGVLISETGTVLTAKHVVFGRKEGVPENTIECYGSIGAKMNSKNPRVYERLLLGRKSPLDAMLLKFLSGNKKFTHLKSSCFSGEGLKRRTIYSTGFSSHKSNLTPSSRKGVISTIELTNSDRLMTVDSLIARGMSGGVVTLEDSADIVGIISGTNFDNTTGLPTIYAVLPIYELTRDLGIKGGKPCKRESRNTNINTRETLDEIEWNSLNSPDEIFIDFDAGNVFCYMTRVFGNFNHAKDKVGITINKSNKYRIQGYNDGGGNHGASFKCSYR